MVLYLYGHFSQGCGSLEGAWNTLWSVEKMLEPYIEAFRAFPWGFGKSGNTFWSAEKVFGNEGKNSLERRKISRGDKKRFRMLEKVFGCQEKYLGKLSLLQSFEVEWDFLLLSGQKKAGWALPLLASYACSKNTGSARNEGYATPLAHPTSYRAWHWTPASLPE